MSSPKTKIFGQNVGKPPGATKARQCYHTVTGGWGSPLPWPCECSNAAPELGPVFQRQLTTDTPDEYLQAWRHYKHGTGEVWVCEEYRTDVILKRSYTPVCAGQKDIKRGKISGVPSIRSLRNLVFKLNNSDDPSRLLLTITFVPEVANSLGVDGVKRLIKAVLRRIKKDGATQVVWVREFTEKKTPHYHLYLNRFLDCEMDSGKVLIWESSALSGYVCDWIERHFPDIKNRLYFMRNGDGKDHTGTARLEWLRHDAAGRYAGKEGAKRIQKEPHPDWNEAGLWWGSTGKITCSPKGTYLCHGSDIEQATVELKDGTEISVPYKIQHRHPGKIPNSYRGISKDSEASPNDQN